MLRPDELRASVEEYLDGLELSRDVGGLGEAMRYALEGGGKRIRPVLCLATAEAAGGDVDRAFPAAAALELVHSFSLVHDDLPAILAGDALLTEAFSLALRFPGNEIARELAQATSGMIAGQFLDVDGGTPDRGKLNRLKTGRLFEASVACGLYAAEVPEAEHQAWRAFGADYGFLYQVVDDLLDGDGFTEELGEERTRSLASQAEDAARARLLELPVDTSVLQELVEELTARIP